MKTFAYTPILLFVLALACGVLFLWGYMYREVKASYGRAAVARSVVLAQTQNSQDSQDLSVFFEDTAEKREELKNFFIPAEKAVSFIESIEKMGQDLGVSASLSGVNLDAPKTGSFAKITARVDVDGSWQEVMKALIYAENLPYQSSIDSIALSWGEGAGKNAKPNWHLSYNLSGTVLTGTSSAQTK